MRRGVGKISFYAKRDAEDATELSERERLGIGMVESGVSDEEEGEDNVEEDDELENAGAAMWKPEFMGDQSELDEFISKAADAA